MSDVYSDTYWQLKFKVTEADLDRVEKHIEKMDQAQDLTNLVRRIIRGRLRHGAEDSRTAQGVQEGIADRSVRLWDPAGNWNIGNHAIIWTWSYARRTQEAKIGEVIEQDINRVYIWVEDTRDQKRIFERAEPGSPEAQLWRRTVEKAVERLRQKDDTNEIIELIAFEHGDRIGSQLLDALRADERFVRLEGRWFLQRLAILPSEAQLEAVAWAMVGSKDPQLTSALLSLLPAPVANGDAGLFGLYLALRAHPNLFTNADSGQIPAWVLAGPPPGPVAVLHPAYDPQTYEILCEPGETIGNEVVQYLWKLDIFDAVCTHTE